MLSRIHIFRIFTAGADAAVRGEVSLRGEGWISSFEMFY